MRQNYALHITALIASCVDKVSPRRFTKIAEMVSSLESFAKFDPFTFTVLNKCTWSSIEWTPCTMGSLELMGGLLNFAGLRQPRHGRVTEKGCLAQGWLRYECWWYPTMDPVVAGHHKT